MHGAPLVAVQQGSLVALAFRAVFRTCQLLRSFGSQGVITTDSELCGQNLQT